MSESKSEDNEASLIDADETRDSVLMDDERRRWEIEREQVCCYLVYIIT